MRLAGQDLRADDERGYAMAALLVAMSVMAVLMTVAMPVWKHAAQREKEEELVFRGEQYARAIGLFQRKFAGAAPPSIDFLVEQRFLRKKYKDPITNDDFVPLTQAQNNAPGAMPNGGRGAATPGGQPPPTGSAELTPLGARQTGPAPRPGSVQPGSAQPGSIPGGIMGVTSKSKEKSIRLYKGRNHYNEWQFVFTQQTAAPGAGGGEATAPGQRGRGQGGGAFGPGQRGRGQRGRGGREDGRGFGGRGQTPSQPQRRPGR